MRARALRAAVVLWILGLVHLVGPARAADAERRILFIAGRPSHGYGAHEHLAGSRVLAETVKQLNGQVHVDVSSGWPEDAGLLDRASTIVIYSGGGGGHPLVKHLDQVRPLMAKGTGLVCLHYAVEVPKGPVGDEFKGWLGGFFEPHWSVNPHWEADFQALPEHPVTGGVRPFKAHDEWYFHMRFVDGMAGVTPILTAVPAADTMRRPDGPHSGNPHVRRAVAAGEPQHLAWAYERPGGGRSFGFTGGHFHWNWGRPEIRRLVGNAILWTAGAELPSAGPPIGVLTAEQLADGQDETRPPKFNLERIRRDFELAGPPPESDLPR